MLFFFFMRLVSFDFHTPRSGFSTNGTAREARGCGGGHVPASLLPPGHGAGQGLRGTRGSPRPAPPLCLLPASGTPLVWVPGVLRPHPSPAVPCPGLAQLMARDGDRDRDRATRHLCRASQSIPRAVGSPLPAQTFPSPRVAGALRGDAGRRGGAGTPPRTPPAPSPLPRPPMALPRAPQLPGGLRWGQGREQPRVLAMAAGTPGESGLGILGLGTPGLGRAGDAPALPAGSSSCRPGESVIFIRGQQ